MVLRDKLSLDSLAFDSIYFLLGWLQGCRFRLWIMGLGPGL